MSNSLNPGQARQFVGPDLRPNCLQRLNYQQTILAGYRHRWRVYKFLRWMFKSISGKRKRWKENMLHLWLICGSCQWSHASVKTWSKKDLLIWIRNLKSDYPKTLENTDYSMQFYTIVYLNSYMLVLKFSRPVSYFFTVCPNATTIFFP